MHWPLFSLISDSILLHNIFISRWVVLVPHPITIRLFPLIVGPKLQSTLNSHKQRKMQRATDYLCKMWIWDYPKKVIQTIQLLSKSTFKMLQNVDNQETSKDRSNFLMRLLKYRMREIFRKMPITLGFITMLGWHMASLVSTRKQQTSSLRLLNSITKIWALNFTKC